MSGDTQGWGQGGRDPHGALGTPGMGSGCQERLGEASQVGKLRQGTPGTPKLTPFRGTLRQGTPKLTPF